MRNADIVVGNPPYVRIEHLSPELLAVYKRRFVSLYDRADLYVAFIEHGLAQLSPRGNLTYICADRWTLNRYGRKLRRVIQEKYKVNTYVDLHLAAPFESELIAYPAIFSIGRQNDRPVRVAKMDDASPEECRSIGQALLARKAPSAVHEYENWFPGSAPGVISSPTHLKTLRRLEARFPALEDEGGTRVGIGVATGNDRVYVVDRSLDVEPDRLVPLVMRTDIQDGTIHDAGRAVINTFENGAGAVDLDRFPRLAKYFASQSKSIKERHVARKNPTSWFRTIDRVYPDLVPTPKLLIPDIAGSTQVAYDQGRFYPHHNLYYIVSSGWDLEILGGLLSSRVSLFFVWSYAVRMRGGYLRFQAQYLRRIRIPAQHTLSNKVGSQLRSAFRRRDFPRIDELSRQAYELDALPDFDFVDTRT